MQSTWSRNWQATPESLPRIPMNRNKRLKDMTLEDEPLRLEGIQYATGEEQRTSSSRANEVAGQKTKGCSAADTPGSERSFSPSNVFVFAALLSGYCQYWSQSCRDCAI